MSTRNLGRSTFGDPANTGNLMPFEEALTFTPLVGIAPSSMFRLHQQTTMVSLGNV